MTDWNAQIIEEFRGNDGEVGGMFTGAPLLLLHHIGRSSGIERIAPLMYLSEDDRVYVFASKAGADSHPDWYLNICKNPAVTYEVGNRTLEATASEIVGDERDAIYSRQSEAWPNFAEYQRATDRVIPVIELRS